MSQGNCDADGRTHHKKFDEGEAQEHLAWTLAPLLHHSLSLKVTDTNQNDEEQSLSNQ